MKELKRFRTKDVSYLFQAPNGVPGDITRTDESNVEPIMLQQNGSPLAYPQSFGLANIYVAGGVGAWQTTNVAADFCGSLVREVPGIGGYTSDTFLPNIPNPAYPTGLCVRGYISVLCQYGTPARGGVVYVNIQAVAGRVVGGFEATSEPSFNVALSATQAEWASDGVDAFQNAELRIAR